ncbi:MAG TPA: hypothetical protein VJM33_15830 [Microthrixaceae bacterium]|nr:hypothetical protein [Microthrixaceae bacterium]
MTNASDVVVTTGNAPRLHLSSAPDRGTDLLGIPVDGLVRLPPVPTDLAFRIHLIATDCPYGPVYIEILVCGDGTITSGSWNADLGATDHEPMSIAGAYPMLMGWLHDKVILGHLLWAGAEVKGDLIDYAAVDGIVSAPAGPRPEAALVDAVMAGCIAAATTGRDSTRTTLTRWD